jgi:hypothetical protein
MTLAQHATADVEARTRASSLAQSTKGDEFDQPHMKDEEVPDLERTNSKHIPDSLINPETKLIPEAHPGISSDNRMETTAAIADKISSPERKSANLVKEREDAKAKDSGRETTQAMPTREKDPNSQGTESDSQKQEPSPPKKNQNAVLLAEDNIVSRPVVEEHVVMLTYDAPDQPKSAHAPAQI